MDAPDVPFGAPDTRTVHILPRDVSDTGLRERSAVKHAATNLLKSVDTATKAQTFSLVVCADPNASSLGCLRGLSAFLLRQVGNQYTQKVLAGLRLLEYLGGPRVMLSMLMTCSIASRTPSHQLRGRVRALQVRAQLLDAQTVPRQDPSAVETAILRPAESERLRTMLEVCRLVQQIHIPATSEDRRAVEFIASVLGKDAKDLLQLIGKAALYSAHPQVRLAESIYAAVWDWAVRLVNAAWAVGQESGGAPGITISLTSVPSGNGTDFASFAAYIAGEATAQWVADVLPVSTLLGDHPPSMRPSVEELPSLRDTTFSHAAAGLFGEAGLLHFLGAGERSAAAVAGFVELIRDGDLAMRRFFGPRARENLRVRSGELLVNFELQAIAEATKVDPYGEITVETEFCGWNPYEDVSRVGAEASTVIRLLNRLTDHCKVVRGSVVVFHVAFDENPPTSCPAPVRLLDTWRDTVKLKDLLEYVDELHIGTDPLKVVEMITGPDSFRRQGDDAHFMPGMLRTLLLVCGDHAQEADVPEGVQPKWLQPGPRMAHLPRSWTTPKQLRIGQQANFTTTMTTDFPIKPWGSRTPRGYEDESGANRSEIFYAHSIDSRKKPTSVGRADERAEATRLFMQTNVMKGTDKLIEDSMELAHAASMRAPVVTDQSMSAESAEVMLFQRDPVHDEQPIGPAVMKCLDKMRAVFKGNIARRRMADLQREHVAAGRIQLAYAEWRRCRSAAAQTIQNSYRSALFIDIVRGTKEAKRMLTVETGADDAAHTRQPYPRDTVFAFPIIAGQSAPPSTQHGLIRAVTNVVAQHCGIPRDLVTLGPLDRGTGGAVLRIAVPYRVRSYLQPLAEQITATGSIWQPVIDQMLELGWTHAKEPSRPSLAGGPGTPRKSQSRIMRGGRAEDLGKHRSPSHGRSPQADKRSPMKSPMTPQRAMGLSSP